MSDSSHKPASVDEYIAGFPPDIQERLQQVRSLIQQLAPEAKEIISYSMPAYKIPGVKGYPAIYLAAHANHIGMYPLPRHTPDVLTEQLKKYQTGKGTVQFKHNEPLPLDFIKQLVIARVNETKQ